MQPSVATFPVENQDKAGTYSGISISTALVASTVSIFLTVNPQATMEQIYNYLGISLNPLLTSDWLQVKGGEGQGTA